MGKRDLPPAAKPQEDRADPDAQMCVPKTVWSKHGAGAQHGQAQRLLLRALLNQVLLGKFGLGVGIAQLGMAFKP